MAKDKNKNVDDIPGNGHWPEAGQFARRDDVSCAPLPGFKAKYNLDWGLQDGEGKQDFPGNVLNNPVDIHKGEFPANGWLEIASDIEATSGKGSSGPGGEKR